MTPDEKRNIEEEQALEAAERAKAKDLKYFRSDIAGLTVHVGAPTGLAGAPENERFVPYYERVNGDDTKVGYLATSDARTIAACEADFHCTLLTKREFTDSTTEKYGDNGETLGARRAAY